MGNHLILTLMIILVTAGASIWFGYKIAIDNITEEDIEEAKEKAFKEAKAKYLEYFHEHFDPQAETAISMFNKSLERENKELREQYILLKEELKKEKKKNESISSS